MSATDDLESSLAPLFEPAMRKGAFISALLISLMCGGRAAAQASATGAVTGSKPAISKIHITNDDQALTIEVSTSSPAIPDTQRLENPDRLVFDFPGFVLQGPTQRLSVNKGPVTTVRASLFQASPPLSRIVIDLKEPASVELQPMEDKVLIRVPFEKAASAPIEKLPKQELPPPAATVTPPTPVASSDVAPRSAPGAVQTVSPHPASDVSVSKPGSEYDVLAKAQAVTLEELPALEAKAQAGEPQSQTLLALAYHSGALLRNDEVEALRLLRLAAEKGYMPAEESLGIYYAAGIGMEKPDPQAALKWYTAASQKGSVDATTNIGSMYASGDGVPKDMTTAIQWFRQAAEAGGGSAAYDLAIIYTRGDGVPRDQQMAASWLTKAADHDFVPALRDQGIRAAYPRDGSATDVPLALQRLKRGAELGDAISQAILGDIFSNGELVKADYRLAANYYKMAADQGQRDGEFGLAVRYVTGQGMPLDRAEAQRWFKAAADQGHADAQYDLGTMYEVGDGTGADLPSALHYYELAAQQGVVKAQYRLGVLLSKGAGVPTDRVSAYKWLMLSQDSVKSSATALNELRHSMSPEEIAEAERQVDSWRIERKQSHK
jgi:TPR repeat protein